MVGISSAKLLHTYLPKEACSLESLQHSSIRVCQDHMQLGVRLEQQIHYHIQTCGVHEAGAAQIQHQVLCSFARRPLMEGKDTIALGSRHCSALRCT